MRKPTLLTEEEVLDALHKEVEFTSLTAVAKKYGLAASQISDVLSHRANLSKRMAEYLGYIVKRYFERTIK